MKIVQMTMVVLALSACGGSGNVESNNSSSNFRAQATQIPCEIHVHCREVTNYPAINNARPGTRGALTPPITSSYTGHAYAVSVYLPASYHESINLLPVIYSLDGDRLFSERADEIDNQQKEVILVSIHADNSRNSDYLYYDEFGNTKNGQDFYNYIVFELMPFVEASFRIDPNQRALEGHSHGGTFVSYSVFMDNLNSQYFKTYVAQDPSIWIHEESLNNLQTSLSNQISDLNINLYLSSGLPGDRDGSNGDATEALYVYFVNESFENLNIHYYSYDLDHGAMNAPAFADFLHDHY